MDQRRTIITPFVDCASVDVRSAIDAIFYDASSVTAFSCEEDRAAFHWRWLGRYLDREPQHTFVAHDSDRKVCGYLVGSLVDPAQRREFDDLGYFQIFGGLTARFPAHLHINVAAAKRSTGIGAQLIDAFGDHARQNGVNGMHVVTGKGMRNVGFYERLGFQELGVADHRVGQVVLLGKQL